MEALHIRLPSTVLTAIKLQTKYQLLCYIIKTSPNVQQKYDVNMTLQLTAHVTEVERIPLRS